MITGTFDSQYTYKYTCGHTTEVQAGGSPPRVCEECGDGLLKPPRWAMFTHNYYYKPDFADVIPQKLWQLGEVFFPIPRGRKGWSYPHHMDDHRYAADSEELNAYLEAGWGYGISMAGDLVVVDIDDLAFLDQIKSKLPDTLWQVTGSGEGVHLFFRVEGLDTRVTLYYNSVYDSLDFANNAGILSEFVSETAKAVYDFKDNWYHIGEIKCDPHGYVVGPGSVHPSGNKYGPLNGDSIATVSKKELLSVVEPYRKPRVSESKYKADIDLGDRVKDYDDAETHTLYTLTADDVLPELEPGERIGHPVADHGSTTGTNFVKNDDNETFTCWHCQCGRSDGCGINAAQYLAVKATSMDCEDARRYWGSDPVLHYKAWLQGVEDGLIDYRNPPYQAVEGYGIELGLIGRDTPMTAPKYFRIEQLLEWAGMSVRRW